MRRSILLYLLYGLVALVGAYFALVAVKGRPGALAILFGPIERQVVDFETLRLKDTPNQYLVCPEGTCSGQAHTVSPSFPIPVEQLQSAWFEMITQQSSTTVISRNEPARQFDIETLTPLVGFPDTVTVRFLELPEGQSGLQIYSRSHYGRSDLGANKKRIDQWLQELIAGIRQNG